MPLIPKFGSKRCTFQYKIRVHGADHLRSDANWTSVPQLFFKCKRNKKTYRTELTTIKEGTVVWESDIAFLAKLSWDKKAKTFDRKFFTMAVQTPSKGLDYSTGVDIAMFAALGERKVTHKSFNLYPSGILRLTIMCEDVELLKAPGYEPAGASFDPGFFYNSDGTIIDENRKRISANNSMSNVLENGGADPLGTTLSFNGSVLGSGGGQSRRSSGDMSSPCKEEKYDDEPGTQLFSYQVPSTSSARSGHASHSGGSDDSKSVISDMSSKTDGSSTVALYFGKKKVDLSAFQKIGGPNDEQDQSAPQHGAIEPEEPRLVSEIETFRMRQGEPQDVSSVRTTIGEETGLREYLAEQAASTNGEAADRPDRQGETSVGEDNTTLEGVENPDEPVTVLLAEKQQQQALQSRGRSMTGISLEPQVGDPNSSVRMSRGVSVATVDMSEPRRADSRLRDEEQLQGFEEGKHAPVNAHSEVDRQLLEEARKYDMGRSVGVVFKAKFKKVMNEIGSIPEAERRQAEQSDYKAAVQYYRRASTPDTSLHLRLPSFHRVAEVLKPISPRNDRAFSAPAHEIKNNSNRLSAGSPHVTEFEIRLMWEQQKVIPIGIVQAPNDTLLADFRLMVAEELDHVPTTHYFLNTKGVPVDPLDERKTMVTQVARGDIVILLPILPTASAVQKA